MCRDELLGPCIRRHSAIILILAPNAMTTQTGNGVNLRSTTLSLVHLRLNQGGAEQGPSAYSIIKSSVVSRATPDPIIQSAHVQCY